MPTNLAFDAGIGLFILFLLMVAGDYAIAAFRFAIACAVGTALYLALDYAAAGTGLAVGVNPATVLAAGLFGPFGVALTVLARLLFGP